ncbi:MAG: fatty acid CoA ligase family protein [Bradymonadia bacterium]
MSDRLNISDALARQATERPDAIAIHEPVKAQGEGVPVYRAFSYRTLETTCDEIARGLLAVGMVPGTRVAVMVKPSFELFALTFGLFRAGMVPVLIDPGIGVKRMGRCLDEAQVGAFIGIPAAHIARLVFGWGRRHIKTLITVGRFRLWGGQSLLRVRAAAKNWTKPLPATRGADLAAILFTSGSTGSPKGVCYQMRHFIEQTELIRSIYQIKPGEVDLPTFPLFALFDPALGMTTVIPMMNPTKPAKANPKILSSTIDAFGVTNMFGSPALLNTLSRFCDQDERHLSTLKRVISAGAAVPSDTIARLRRWLPSDAAINTPYGATECLPVATANDALLMGKTRLRTADGAGVCVGRVVPPNLVRIIEITDEVINTWADVNELETGQIGEITVAGPTTTQRYFAREEANQLAKIEDVDLGMNVHRMGDVGYLDDDGLLWFCGRKKHRVVGVDDTYFSVPIESVFNTHPDVYRSALVALDTDGRPVPGLCVELESGATRDWGVIRAELVELGQRRPLTSDITEFFCHKAFPVDIRHNAKIEREQLSQWAMRQR